MRTQDWALALTFLAAGCSVIVDKKLDDKPNELSSDDTGDGDGDNPLEDGGNHSGDGATGGDGGVGDGDGDTMMVDGGDNLGPGPDGGGPATRADIKICVGATHGCRLFPNGILRCWGNNDQQQASLSEGTFKDVACGDYHTCGVTNTGGVTCVGRNSDGQRDDAPTTGSYKAVTAGDSHSCALRSDDTVACWGNDAEHQSTPPSGVTFSAISAGQSFTCGIRTSDSKIQCWGSSSSNRLKPPTDSTFKAIDLGPNYGCGITTDGVVRCWGNTDFIAPGLTDVRAISMGTYHACAVKNDKSGSCWPASPLPLPDTYLGVASGPSGYLFTPETGEPQTFAYESFFPTPPAMFYQSP